MISDILEDPTPHHRKCHVLFEWSLKTDFDWNIFLPTIAYVTMSAKFPIALGTATAKKAAAYVWKDSTGSSARKVCLIVVFVTLVAVVTAAVVVADTAVVVAAAVVDVLSTILMVNFR